MSRWVITKSEDVVVGDRIRLVECRSHPDESWWVLNLLRPVLSDEDETFFVVIDDAGVVSHLLTDAPEFEVLREERAGFEFL